MGSCISHDSDHRRYVQSNRRAPRSRARSTNTLSSNDIVNTQSTQTLGLNKKTKRLQNLRSKFAGKCIINCSSDSVSENMSTSDIDERNRQRNRLGNRQMPGHDYEDDDDDDEDSIISYNCRFRHVNDIVGDILQAIRSIVINNSDDEPPAVINELQEMASNEKSWIKILIALVERVKLNDPLGPAIIALFLEECPLPSKDSIMHLFKKIPIWKLNVQKNEERNCFVVFSCLSEKIAGPYSSLMLTKETLDYIFAKFTNLSKYSNSELNKAIMEELNVVLFSLIALEKFAVSIENRLKIMERLNVRMNPLIELSKWHHDPNYLKRQIGFNSIFLLDNVFTHPNHIYGYKTANTKDLNVKLNDNDVTEYLKISPNGLEARNDTVSFESVRCTFSVDSGIWYYEATILTNGIMQIGFATKESKFLNYNGYGIGDDEQSVAYDGCRRLIWHNAESVAHEHKAWKEGDTLGLLLNLTNGTIAFYLNGQALTHVHTKIFKDPKRLKSGFFAAASFMSFQHCIFNFGREPFQYPPKDCRFQNFNDYGTLTDIERVVLPRKLKLDRIRDTIVKEDSCSLCYDNLATIILEPCKHKDFCDSCAQRLTKCPVCRSDITSFQIIQIP